MRRRLASPALLCALLLAVSGCGPERRFEAARRGAVEYFAREVRTVDPGWANLFGYLHRRFGLELVNAAGAALHEVPMEQERPELAAIFRRLVDPGARVPKRTIAELSTPIDRMTASALHCDRIRLPENWNDVLREATRIGGYALTHAALASQWTLEQGCRPEIEVAVLQERQIEALGALVDGRDTLTVGNATDLWIEALVMLYYLGAADRIDPAWLEALLDAQRPDGGWPLGPGAKRSDPHPTALALWVLLENLEPDAAPIRWIAR